MPFLKLDGEKIRFEQDRHRWHGLPCASLLPPAPDAKFTSGDKIAAVGTEANLRRLEDSSRGAVRLTESRPPGDAGS